MEKMKLHSVDVVDLNIKKIEELFPHCITESKTSEGYLAKSIDFDLLRQELSSGIVEGNQERYQINWAGKKEALLTANMPIAKSLRPNYSKSKNFDTTKNLYIEGDNLDALKLLSETYLEKIKLIYIDPPYNTRSDFIYKDDFAEDAEKYFLRTNQKDEQGQRLVALTDSDGRKHSDWLSMMYSRLKLSRNLLSPDGIILISIDENEVHNLRKVCDEIFGSTNYAGEIVWKNSSKNDQAYISIQHEYILCYVKDKAFNDGKWLEKKDGLDEIYKAFDLFKKKHGADWKAIHKEALAWYKQFPPVNPISNSSHYSWMDENGIYFPDNISGPNFGQYRYDVIHPVTKKVCKEPASGWRYPESTMKDRIEKNLVHFGDDETTVPNNKTYLKNTEFQSISSVRFKDGRVASKGLRALMQGDFFTNPKDYEFLAQIFKAMNVQGEDTVLDFFSGSGTTAHAVMHLNSQDSGSRKFLLVQLAEECDPKSAANKAGFKTICDIGQERIRKSGESILASINEDLLNKEIDVGFRVLYVDSSNVSDVYYKPDAVSQDLLSDQTDNVKADRTPDDLLFQVLLDWGVDLSLPIQKESIQGKDVYFVDQNALAACFDSKGGVDEEFVKELAKKQPLRVVFRDAGFKSDSVKINVEQIFKLVSPSTEVKYI